MLEIRKFMGSSIGLKFVMGVSGLLLSLFLLAHVLGNLLIFISPELYNAYGHALTSNKPLLYTAEAGLIALFLAHLFAAITLSKRNRKARVQSYAVKTNSGRSRRSWMSSNMIWSGSFLLFFVIVHLKNFKFGPETTVVQSGVEVRDLAGLVISEFQKPLETAFYTIAIILLTMHLLHGVRSAFATIGVEQPHYMKAIKMISYGYMAVVGIGFLSIPIVIFLTGGVF